MRATITQCVIQRAEFRPCAGRPLLFWLLREFTRYGVSDFLLPNGSTRDQRTIARIQATLPRPARITFIDETTEAHTCLALLHASPLLRERFLLCGGQRLFDGNVATLLAKAAADHGGIVRHTDDGNVFAFRKAMLNSPRPVPTLGTDVPQVLACRVRLPASALSTGGGPAQDAATAIRLRRRALFLDRDGVINVDRGYVGTRDRFEWVDGALAAIRHATEAGWHVFIVTNQSGVARGLYSEAAVRELLDWVADQARAAGGTIDDIRFCPYHPDATVTGYRQAHPWRKPLPGMLLDLIAAWDLDTSRAIMVGDQPTDMQAAAAAGVTGHLFPGGNLLAFLRPILTAIS